MAIDIVRKIKSNESVVAGFRYSWARLAKKLDYFEFSRFFIGSSSSRVRFLPRDQSSRGFFGSQPLASEHFHRFVENLLTVRPFTFEPDNDMQV